MKMFLQEWGFKEFSISSCLRIVSHFGEPPRIYIQVQRKKYFLLNNDKLLPGSKTGWVTRFQIIMFKLDRN